MKHFNLLVSIAHNTKQLTAIAYNTKQTYCHWCKITANKATTPSCFACQTETKESQLKTNPFEILCEFVVGNFWKKNLQYFHTIYIANFENPFAYTYSTDKNYYYWVFRNNSK